MLDQSDFVVIKDADPAIYTDYAATHGLPKSVGLGAVDHRGTSLLRVSGSPFQLSPPKHTNLGKSESALKRDAYLLWRLSERYSDTVFSVGLLDKDRLSRLVQLNALEFVDDVDVVTVATRVRICWGRQSLSRHFERLNEIARSVGGFQTR